MQALISYYVVYQPVCESLYTEACPQTNNDNNNNDIIVIVIVIMCCLGAKARNGGTSLLYAVHQVAPRNSDLRSTDRRLDPVGIS